MEAKTDQVLEARVNLYYDLQPGAHSPAPLLIALHGYGANKRQDDVRGATHEIVPEMREDVVQWLSRR